MIYTNEVLNLLRENFPFVQDTSKHYFVRCPYCGDSSKSKLKAHLGISKKAPVFRCVRCEEFGHITKLIYDMTGIKKRLTSLIQEQYLKTLDQPISTSDIRINVKTNYKIPEQDFQKFSNKVEYLKSRMPLMKVFNDDIKPLVVLDLYQFAEYNKIVIAPERKKLFDWFQEKFVGVCSLNKSLLILRNIDPDSDFRYYLWKLVDTVDDFVVFDKLSEEKEQVTMVIAEGIFDIMNVMNYENPFDIYTVASGKLFKRALKFSLVNKCVSYLDKLVVLSDDDVNVEFHKKYLKHFRSICKSIEIWYNKVGKDFGQKTKVEKIVLTMK